MGVVNINQYVDDDHNIAETSADHFASSGSALTFAGASGATAPPKGGGRGGGKQGGKPLAIKPPPKTLAITDAPWNNGNVKTAKEPCIRFNDKKCNGGSKGGKCPQAEHRWHICSKCVGELTQPATAGLQMARPTRIRNASGE